jgi:hypothetical protein
MKKALVLLSLAGGIVLFQLLNSCRHEFSGNRCAIDPVRITVSPNDASPNQNNGEISAIATGGAVFQYSLNGGTFQDSGHFTGLAPFQSYNVVVKNSWGCTDTGHASINVLDPCSGITVTVTATKTDASPNQNNGSITATATGGTGFTYNINGGAYQASNVFSVLAAGTFTVGVKDANGCTKTASAVVGTASSGPLFAQMRNLISTRCNGSGCHIGNGQNAAGYNFDNDCNIVSKWSQINNTCVIYAQGWVKMPKSPQPFFTAAEKQIVTNWITAGHRYTD